MYLKGRETALDYWLPRLKKAGTTVLVVNFSILFGGFHLLEKIDRDQEFRLRVRESWPTLIDTYYSFYNRKGELYQQIEQQDNEVLRKRREQDI